MYFLCFRVQFWASSPDVSDFNWTLLRYAPSWAFPDAGFISARLQTPGLQPGENAFLLHRRPLRVFQQRSRCLPGGSVQTELPASGNTCLRRQPPPDKSHMQGAEGGVLINVCRCVSARSIRVTWRWWFSSSCPLRLITSTWKVWKGKRCASSCGASSHVESMIRIAMCPKSWRDALLVA